MQNVDIKKLISFKQIFSKKTNCQLSVLYVAPARHLKDFIEQQLEKHLMVRVVQNFSSVSLKKSKFSFRSIRIYSGLFTIFSLKVVFRFEFYQLLASSNQYCSIYRRVTTFSSAQSYFLQSVSLNGSVQASGAINKIVYRVTERGK